MIDFFWWRRRRTRAPVLTAPTRPDVRLERIAADATLAAAPMVDPTGARGGIRERDVEHAFAASLPWPVHPARLRVRDWDPQPGHVDLVGDVPGIGRVLIEAKSGDIQDQLWDLFKLLAAAEPGDCTLLLAAAMRAQFEGRGQCAPLYRGDEWHEWESRRMFSEWERAWRRLLKGGSARPHRVPERVRTRLLARAELPVPGYELRCVQVESLGDGWLEFRDGWPAEEG